MALKTLYYNDKLLTLDGKTLMVNDQGLPEQEKNVSITKNGMTEVVPDVGKTLSKVTIAVDVPTSSTPGAPGDITFYDYDGTIVTSWTLAELATKTALPDYPSHAGLICQGWNWSLADLKTTNRKMNVGAMYIYSPAAYPAGWQEQA